MRLQDLAGIAIIFVVTAIIIGIGADVLSQMQTNMGTDNNTADEQFNATKYGLEGLEELGSWLPTIAIIVAAAVIIGIIAMYFAVR